MLGEFINESFKKHAFTTADCLSFLHKLNFQKIREQIVFSYKRGNSHYDCVFVVTRISASASPVSWVYFHDHKFVKRAQQNIICRFSLRDKNRRRRLLREARAICSECRTKSAFSYKKWRKNLAYPYFSRVYESKWKRQCESALTVLSHLVTTPPILGVNSNKHVFISCFSNFKKSSREVSR